MIEKRKYASWSHAFVVAVTYLKRIEEPEGF